MKRLLLCWLFICPAFMIKAQLPDELNSLDTRAVNIPRAETNSTLSISKYILVNYKTDREKLLAIYSWVTNNIRYDTDSMYVINSARNPEARITEALRRRKGVCENFAAIFNDIAVKCGIISYEVSGYTKQYGSVDKTAHTWCVVQLDKKWLFCDPTWDVGFSKNARYFLVTPAVFIGSHMPFDPLWQLLDHTVSHREFYTGNVDSKKDEPFLNFNDSVNAYLQLNELQQLESAANRIRRSGIANELVKTRLTWLQMEISIIYQEKDMNIYNAAVADLNKANIIFNEFVQYRNSRFIPLKPDLTIRSMLSPVDDLLWAAYKKLDLLDASAVNFQYDTGLLRDKLDHLTRRLREQKDFLKRYFDTAPAEREQLFYH